MLAPQNASFGCRARVCIQRDASIASAVYRMPVISLHMDRSTPASGAALIEGTENRR